MPIIAYACEDKHVSKKYHRQAKEAPVSLTCECGKVSKRQLSMPSSASKVTIDNGFQSRAVEVNMDVIESNKERSTKDYTKED